MKKLLIGLLALTSLSSFATVECEDALNDLVQYSDSIGQTKAFIIRNNSRIQLHTAYLKILNENQSLEKVMGYTRNELIEMSREDVEANKPLVESLLKSPEITEELKLNVKYACK